jgi:hypothetical protein
MAEQRQGEPHHNEQRCDEPRFADWYAIHMLIMRVADLADRGRMADASAMFANGVVRREILVDGEVTIATSEGADGVRSWMDRTPLYSDGTPRTRHVITNPIIEIDRDRATSQSYVTVFQQTPELPLQAIATSCYFDAFECVDGAWRFTDRLIARSMAGDISAHRPRT